MILSRKIRIYPTSEQEHILWKSVGTARYIYNWTLNKQEENYKKGSKFISDNELRKEITQLKKTELIWLTEVSNNVAKQAVKDACNAYKNFFKKVTGYPKYKSRKKSKPSFYNDNGQLKVKEFRVLIAKVGWVKTKEQVPIGCKYTNPRISNDGKYWYLAVGIEKETISEKLSGECIGVDLGIKDLAICSNGMKFKNINKSGKVKKEEKKLRRMQRRVSRKYVMNKDGTSYVKSKNIIKLEKEIKLKHRRLSNIRKNHLHQATTAIVKTKPSRVVMETLNVKGMMKNKHLAKSIGKMGFYEFKRQMKYKCELRGVEFVEADLWYPSSKTCSKCGHIKERLSLSERIFKCDNVECNHELDRDYNASINLSRYVLVK